MPSHSQTPPEVFISYSRKDKKYKDELLKQLKVLAQQDIISTWHDGLLGSGQQWDAEIVEHLNSSRIILLLISPDFLTSDYVNKVELKFAAERHVRKEVCVIPVLVRNVNAWENQPFGELKLGDLQAVPAGKKFIIEWTNRNKAFADVARGIQEAVGKLNKNAANAVPALTIPRPPIVGFVSRRDSEGHDIVERLRDELAPQKLQLVALWGAGGVGKTTLAAEAARTLADDFNQRVVWVTADGRTDLPFTTFLDEIATQLGNEDLRKLAREPKSEAVRALVAGGPSLLVLDNFETISEDERQQCLDFLKRVQCSVLLTTRQRLEHVRSVTIAGMSADEAESFLELLIEQTQDPIIFAAPYRKRLIETAEANPLIMEWVVGQIDLANDPEEVLSELTHGEGDAALRVFDRSYNLPQLNDGGRAVLLALSLFTPSAGRPTVATVAGMNLGKGRDKKRFKKAQETLASLWLIKKMDRGVRLAVAGLTRELTNVHLATDPRGKTFTERFVGTFFVFARAHSKISPGDYDSLELEKDNLLSALDLAFTRGDVRSVAGIADPLENVLLVRGYWDEALHVSALALKTARSSENQPEIAKWLHNRAMMYRNRGENDSARQLMVESLEISKQLGDEVNVAASLHELAIFEQEEGRPDEAHRLYNESLEIEKKLSNQRGLAGSLVQLGSLAFEQGKLDEAHPLFIEALDIAKRIGDQNGIAITIQHLGMLAQKRDDLGEAHRLYKESLEIFKRLGDQHSIATTLHQMGTLLEKEGKLKESEQLIKDALAIFEKLKAPYSEMARRSLERLKRKQS